MLASRGRSGMEHSTRLGHSSVSRLVSFCTAMKTYLFSRTFFDTDNTRDSFYPRDAMLARVIEIATCLSVRPSVCLSVTRRYCVKTKKASVMISSPSGSPKTLVFWRQIW